MGSYIPATGKERQAMLQAIGLTSVDELFDVVPEAVRVKNLDLPEGLSEWEVSQTMASLAEKNRVFRSVFRGGRGIPPLYPVHCENRHQQGGIPHSLYALSGGDQPGGSSVNL